MFTEKYVNPFTDFGFKKLFGTEVNKDLLIDFLNELINEQGRITDIQYKKDYRLGDTETDRKAIFDIYCQSEKGEHFIVEMQKAEQKYFKDRSIFYATFPIRDQAKTGDWDFELQAVYTVGILNFTFNDDENDSNYFHSEVKLLDIKKKTVFYDKLTFIYLEMPKFNKAEDELETHFDKWMYVLKNLPKFQERPSKLQERVFDRLFQVAEIANFSKKEKDAYEDSLKAYRDMNNVLNTREEKGRMEGVIRVAKNLLKMGLDPEQICQATGLTKEQVAGLQSNSN